MTVLYSVCLVVLGAVGCAGFIRQDMEVKEVKEVAGSAQAAAAPDFLAAITACTTAPSRMLKLGPAAEEPGLGEQSLACGGASSFPAKMRRTSRSSSSPGTACKASQPEAGTETETETEVKHTQDTYAYSPYIATAPASSDLAQWPSRGAGCSRFSPHLPFIYSFRGDDVNDIIRSELPSGVLTRISIVISSDY